MELLQRFFAPKLPTSPPPRTQFTVRECGGEWWVISDDGRRYPVPSQGQAMRLAEILNQHTEPLTIN